MADPLEKIRRKNPVSETSAQHSRKSVTESESENSTSFSEILSGVTGGASERKLESILKEISGLASTLSHRKLLEDLERYRTKVGEFLKTYLDEVLDVREASGRKGINRKKQLLVVKRVNVELENLSRFVLGGSPDFEIMKELDTIQGLLMDLYQ